MKLLLKKGTETHKKIMELFNRAVECDKKAKELAISEGAKNFAVMQGGTYFAGEVGAFEFGDVIPDNKLWKRVGNEWQGLWYPKVCNKELRKKLADLEKVKRTELNEIMKFKPHGATINGGLAFVGSLTMDIQLDRELCIVTVEEGVQYKPIADLEEILASRATALLKGEEVV